MGLVMMSWKKKEFEQKGRTPHFIAKAEFETNSGVGVAAQKAPLARSKKGCVSICKTLLVWLDTRVY